MSTTTTTTLTRDELEVAATVIKCSTSDIKVAAPVRLYKSLMGRWNYTGHYGIAAVLVEPTIYTVMIHVVDLSTKSLVLTQECYPQFEYVILSPQMHAFEGDTTLYGLNFAENYDATPFSTTLKGLVSLCNLQNGSRISQPMQLSSQQPVQITHMSLPHPINNMHQQQQQQQMQMQQQQMYIQQQQMAYPASVPQDKKRHSFHFGSKIKNLFHRKPKEKKRPVISGAHDFRHTAHIGFNMNDGFGEIPQEWKAIFQKAGISEEQLKDKKTAKFLTKTIASMNEEAEKENKVTLVPEMEAIQKEAFVPPPLPVTTLQQQPVQVQPQLSISQPPPPPPLPDMNSIQVQQTDLKIEGTSRGPPNNPPPPPVMEPESGSGKEKAVPMSRPADFLSEIQQGKKLKPIAVAEMSEKEQDSFAAKLRQAMEARRPQIGEDDDSSDDDDEFE